MLGNSYLLFKDGVKGLRGPLVGMIAPVAGASSRSRIRVVDLQLAIVAHVPEWLPPFAMWIVQSIYPHSSNASSVGP